MLANSISQLTKIPVTALSGQDPKSFAVQKRVLWINGRDTTKPEDMAYSLLGLLGLPMPAVYGERKTAAFRRFKKEIDDAEKNTSLGFLSRLAMDTQNTSKREVVVSDKASPGSPSDARHIFLGEGLPFFPDNASSVSSEIQSLFGGDVNRRLQENSQRGTKEVRAVAPNVRRAKLPELDESEEDASEVEEYVNYSKNHTYGTNTSPPIAGSQFRCKNCNRMFPSNNKLHDHIRYDRCQ